MSEALTTTGFNGKGEGEPLDRQHQDEDRAIRYAVWVQEEGAFDKVEIRRGSTWVASVHAGGTVTSARGLAAMREHLELRKREMAAALAEDGT